MNQDFSLVNVCTDMFDCHTNSGANVQLTPSIYNRCKKIKKYATYL